MKHRVVIIIIAVIFVLGLIGSAIVLTSPPESAVRIVQNGETLYTVDLSAAEDTSFTIEKNGHYNTVEIKDGRIRVADADCPDLTCVNMGWLTSSAMPIVCLPHGLVIEFIDSDGAVDAVTR